MPNKCWTRPGGEWFVGGVTGVAPCRAESPTTTSVSPDPAHPYTGTRPARLRVPAPLPLVVVANAASMCGNVMTTVAIPWLVLTATGSAALAGAVVFAGAGAAALGGLVAGRIVDQIGPVRASAGADLLSGLAVVPLAILVARNSLDVWPVALLVVVGTLADSAGSAARQSLVPAAADAGGHRRERANALFTSAEHVGYLLGAPIAGLLIAALGTDGSLWVTATVFGCAAVAAALIRLPRPTATAHARHAGTVRARQAGSVREALAFIWRDPALRVLFLTPAVAVLLVGPLVPLVLPVLARESFDDPRVLGMMVATYGAGGLVGAASFGIVGSRVRRRWQYIAIFTIWPLTYAVITLVTRLPVVLAMLVLLGGVLGLLGPLQATIRQERSPQRLLPRVVGLSSATLPVGAPIGILGTGILIDTLGLPTTLPLMTAGAVLIGGSVLLSKGTRAFDADRPHA